MRWRQACALVVASGVGLCAWGQAADGKAAAGPAAPTLSVNARLVQMAVTVREKKGALVQNLTKDKFTLQVDGKPQEIRYFSHDNNLPLTLGLLVDTSMSQRDALDDEKKASEAFVDDMLQDEKDTAFVVQFARQTDLLADVTQSKPKVEAGIRKLDSVGGSGGNDQSGTDAVDGRRSGRGGRGGGTTLYDALFLSSDEVTGKQQGRKALILLSDGDDRGSKESLSSSIEAAQKADTVVYAIYFKGKQVGGGGGFPQAGGRRGGGFPGAGGGGWPGSGGGSQHGGGGGQQAQADGKKMRRAAGCVRGRRRTRSMAFTNRLRRSCAASMWWASLRTKPPRKRGITGSI
jgi:VWFA-related protein